MKTPYAPVIIYPTGGLSILPSIHPSSHPSTTAPFEGDVVAFFEKATSSDDTSTNNKVAPAVFRSPGNRTPYILTSAGRASVRARPRAPYDVVYGGVGVKKVCSTQVGCALNTM